MNAEDQEGGSRDGSASISNSYNPLLSFPMWFPGVEGIVVHYEGEWKDRAWAETHRQSDMIQ